MKIRIGEITLTKIIIPILANQEIEIEIDPNPNGYPVLIIHNRIKEGRLLSSMFLGEQQTKKLIKELQETLPEIKE